MLVLNMIYVDLIVKKKKKSTGILRCFSHALDPLGFGGVINIPMSRTESKYKTKKKNVKIGRAHVWTPVTA